MISIPATLAVISLMAAGVAIPQDIDILSKIEIAAIQNQVDPDQMKALSFCESRYNMRAHNSSDPNDGSFGLFQYQKRTFFDTSKQYGLENPDIFNYDHQIKITAYLLAQGKWKLWYNCSKKIGAI